MKRLRYASRTGTILYWAGGVWTRQPAEATRLDDQEAESMLQVVRESMILAPNNVALEEWA